MSYAKDMETRNEPRLAAVEFRNPETELCILGHPTTVHVRCVERGIETPGFLLLKASLIPESV